MHRLVLFLLLVSASCTPPPGGGDAVCTDGFVEACACPGGQTGAAACVGGWLEPCQCDGEADDPLCSYDCEGRVCGDDGCGGVCGTCADGASCSDAGTCAAQDLCGDGECSEAESCATCTADCGCDEACLEGACGPACDGPACGETSPEILDLTVSRPDLTVGQSLTVSAIVADPDGPDDIAGVVLADANGSRLGAMAGLGGGVYEAAVSWEVLHDVAAIEFVRGAERVLLVEVLDAEGHRVRANVAIGLHCQGDGACDGVCTSLDTGEDCGACGRVCDIGVCAGGACTCGDGLRNCSDACVDTDTDLQHCGACGRACEGVGGGAPACVAGRCAIECDDPLLECDGQCIDTASSVDHCGGCGVACAGPVGSLSSCESSQCQFECEPSLTRCGDSCASCPTENVTRSACDGERCVATACAEPHRLSNGRCTAPIHERVSTFEHLFSFLERPPLSLAITQDGEPHFAVGAESHVRWGRRRGPGDWETGSFRLSQGDSMPWQRVAVTIVAGDPVVAFVDGPADRRGQKDATLTVARRRNDRWASQTLHTAYNEDVITSLTMLPYNGDVEVFYSVADLDFATDRLSAANALTSYRWTDADGSEELPIDDGPSCVFARDADGLHAVTQLGSGPLGYTTVERSPTWATLAQNVAGPARIVAGPEGPLVVWTNNEGGLSWARRADGWTASEIPGTGEVHYAFPFDAAVDGRGRVHVCYGVRGGVYTAVHEQNRWTSELRAEAGNVRSCALAFHGGDLHLVYTQVDGETHEVFYKH